MNKTIKIRLFLWSVLAAVTFFLVWRAIVPFGQIGYATDFRQENYFIQKLTPAERVEKGEAGMRLTGDPVYFNLRTPRRFDRAVLTVEYKRSKGTEFPIGNSVPGLAFPIIEAGVLVDGMVRNYDLKPLENLIINGLATDWHAVRDNGVTLLQREKRYDSVADFLGELPPPGEIALYNYSLPTARTLDGYASTTKTLSLTQALRGPYRFYTYLDDEELDFTFSFVDLNLNRDPDPVDINVYYAGAAIDSRRLEDDGITDDTGAKSDRRELELKLARLPAGFYLLEVKANDDIVTKQITTKQQKLSFIGKIALAAEDRTEIALYTDSLAAHFLTADPGKLQTIAIGDDKLELAETYKQYSTRLSATTTEINLAKDGVIVAGDGVFSFSPEALVNPDYRKISGALDLDAAGINYVLARYEIPVEKDGLRTARAEFDLSGVYREFGRYGFIISIPGLKADDEAEDFVEIREIRVELEGKSLWKKVKEIFKDQ